jgi:hypothetical protein
MRAAILMRSGQSSCHRVNRAAVPRGLIGPQLDGIGDRVEIAGAPQKTQAVLGGGLCAADRFMPAA